MEPQISNLLCLCHSTIYATCYMHIDFEKGLHILDKLNIELDQ